MNKIEIKPSDKTRVRSCYTLRPHTKEHLTPEELDKLLKARLVELMSPILIDKIKVKEIPMEHLGPNTFDTELYVFTPEEMTQFIDEIQHRMLHFCNCKHLISK